MMMNKKESMIVLLKFLKGKDDRIISKIPGNVLSDSFDSRFWIVFPHRRYEDVIKEERVYECELLRTRRNGILIAIPIREVEKEDELFELLKIKEENLYNGEVKVLAELVSKYYPKEIVQRELNYEFVLENGEIRIVSEECFGNRLNKIVTENHWLWSKVPQELKEKYLKIKEEDNQKQCKLDNEVNEKIKNIEKKIVKTRLERRDHELTLDEIEVRHTFDDEEFGLRKPTYSYVGTRIESRRGLTFKEAWRRIVPKNYHLPSDPYEVVNYTEDIYSEYFKYIEKFNQTFYEERQKLSKEAIDSITEEIKNIDNRYVNDYRTKLQQTEFIRYLRKK